MAEVASRAKLSTVGVEGHHPTATFAGIDYNMLTREGPRLGLQIDRGTWELLGRPVDITVSIESGTTSATFDVAREVMVERTLQEANGYDAAHDDEHGIQHLMEQVQRRVAGKLWTRDDLIEAAAVLVASVEWMDRHADPYPPGPYTPLTNAQGPVEDLSRPQRL